MTVRCHPKTTATSYNQTKNQSEKNRTYLKPGENAVVDEDEDEDVGIGGAE